VAKTEYVVGKDGNDLMEKRVDTIVLSDKEGNGLCREVWFRPEGTRYPSQENREALQSRLSLERAMQNKTILEGNVIMCDHDYTLSVGLGCLRGVMFREEVQLTPEGEAVRDIAVITRVGKTICFVIVGFSRDENGNECAILSRKEAQRICKANFLSKLRPGDVIPAKVTHLEHFGAFVDIGCGIVSLLSIDCISVSRISHPKDRFFPGMQIYVIIKSIDGESGRIYVSHKELLGTWEENAAQFSLGQTVTGIVRSIENYGVFVELTPNLAGLAEYREDITVGQFAAVYIKNMIPERMKVKLVLVDSYRGEGYNRKLEYFIRSGHLDRWDYSPAVSQRRVETVFVEEMVK